LSHLDKPVRVQTIRPELAARSKLLGARGANLQCTRAPPRHSDIHDRAEQQEHNLASNHAAASPLSRLGHAFIVAVAVASGESPPILNAVDSDWWNHREALVESGFVVDFLCPQHAPHG
jgi:hypothetical protein